MQEQMKATKPAPGAWPLTLTEPGRREAGRSLQAESEPGTVESKEDRGRLGGGGRGSGEQKRGKQTEWKKKERENKENGKQKEEVVGGGKE